MCLGWDIMNKPTVIGSLLLIGLVAFVAGRYSARSSHDNHTASRRILYYVDPMHPAYHSDKPGLAPDCGMPLEPVYESEDAAANLQLHAGAVSISPEKQQLIGIRVETVEKNSGPRRIRTTGRVEADDNRVYRLMAGTEGWVRSLENNPAGTIVKKNELLATFYSREFRNAEQAYLGSLASVERLKSDDPNRTSDANLRINEEQLRALGMGDPQIKELGKARQITRDIALTSPVDGIVLSRNISPQQRFEKGVEFYRIGDLSNVWIIADVFGNEAQLFRPGAKVRVTARELGKTLYATVSKNPPLFDPASRTLKLRLEADNPGFALRPDMFVDLEFSIPAPPGVSVPQEAVLDSGMQKIVYVEVGEGVFEPRPVEIGTPYGGWVTILRGLAEGNRVVTSGNFLLDSESRMRSSPLVSSGTAHEANRHANRDGVSTHDPVSSKPVVAGHAQSSGHVEKHHRQSPVSHSQQSQKKFRQTSAKYPTEKQGNAETSQGQIEARR
jgi:RND family efflux transporter MFP subunit